MGLKPDFKPKIKSNGPSLAQDKYVTHCKLCPYAIFSGQKYHWSNRPIGWVHDECVTPNPGS